MTPSARPVRGPMCLALCLGLLASAAFAGCRGCDEAPIARDEPAFHLLPASATTLVSFDLRRIRESPLWRALAEGAMQRPEDRRLLDALKARTGFDPMEDLHRITLAFPEDARVAGEFAVVLQGQNMDERRLVAYARDEARVRGYAIVQKQHAGRRLWEGQDARVRRAGFFVGGDTLVVAGGGWAEGIAEVTAGGGRRSLAEEGQVARLLRRIGPEHAAWGAMLVPAHVRTQLAADARLGAAAAIERLAVWVDLEGGVALAARGESSTAEHAAALAAELERYVLEARQSPKMLLLGLAPWLQGVRVRSEGPVVKAQLSLDAGQTETLIARCKSLMQAARGALRPR